MMERNPKSMLAKDRGAGPEHAIPRDVDRRVHWTSAWWDGVSIHFVENPIRQSGDAPPAARTLGCIGEPMS